MGIAISGLAHHLPRGTLTNEALAADFPDWSVQKIAAKTGIHSRHIVGEGEYASDLGTAAARRLFEQSNISPHDVGYLIFCTQTPDFVMPSTSVLVHERLGLRSDAGAIDVSLGCSGYVSSLGLARGLIESGQVESVLVITADTYSRLLNPQDKSVRTLFGDAGTATLVTAGDHDGVHSFVYGSDGSGAGALVVPTGGFAPATEFPAAEVARRGFAASEYDLFMDGPAVFNFALRVVPDLVRDVLQKAHSEAGEIDSWIFHQANAFMLSHLRRKLGIAEDRFVIDLADTGNTASSSIPLVMSRLRERGGLPSGSRSLIAGFGVGLAWAGAVIDW